MMIVKAILLAILVAASAPAFAATSSMQGTPKERAACRSDVRKYCSALKPGSDSYDFLHCLQAHRLKLKAACRGVLESHGQ